MQSWITGNWWPAIANLAGLLIWGGMTHQRLRTLERDVASLQDLGSRMARVEARIEGLYEQFRELNASIRWMRSPEAYPPIKVRAPVQERDDGR
jgi:hypothetical protein